METLMFILAAGAPRARSRSIPLPASIIGILVEGTVELSLVVLEVSLDSNDPILFPQIHR